VYEMSLWSYPIKSAVIVFCIVVKSGRPLLCPLPPSGEIMQLIDGWSIFLSRGTLLIGHICLQVDYLNYRHANGLLIRAFGLVNEKIESYPSVFLSPTIDGPHNCGSRHVVHVPQSLNKVSTTTILLRLL
jgi:hypothetical protein